MKKKPSAFLRIFLLGLLVGGGAFQSWGSGGFMVVLVITGMAVILHESWEERRR